MNISVDSRTGTGSFFGGAAASGSCAMQPRLLDRTSDIR
jgi:hypothetical protein